VFIAVSCAELLYKRIERFGKSERPILVGDIKYISYGEILRRNYLIIFNQFKKERNGRRHRKLDPITE
jgi:hypothetical protein